MIPRIQKIFFVTTIFYFNKKKTIFKLFPYIHKQGYHKVIFIQFFSKKIHILYTSLNAPEPIFTNYVYWFKSNVISSLI